MTSVKASGEKEFQMGFVQLGCPSYKRPMFEHLKNLPNVCLTLFIGDKAPLGHAPNGELDGLGAVPIKNKIFRFLGIQFVWQSVNSHLSPRMFDLIVLPEGILYLSNYVLMIRAWAAGVPVAFYSHGYNHQRKNSFRGLVAEKIRKTIHSCAATIITYSQSGADFIIKSNPSMHGRVFVALNTLDVGAINEEIKNVSSADIEIMRNGWGFGADDVVLAFAGRISVEKNPRYVVEAVKALRAEGLPVRAIFIGDGPELLMLKQLIEEQSIELDQSIKMLGRVDVSEVGRFLKATDISVMPGMTGLAVVHSFAVGLPYVTIESLLHSPEIEYLRPGENGVITSANLPAFISALRKLVLDVESRKLMGESGRKFALEKLGVEHQMAGFKDAIKFVEGEKLARK